MAGNISDITDSNFNDEVLKSENPVLIDFWAPWCGPCLAVGPILEELAEEYKGKIKVVKMNVDENAQQPAEIGVRSIPYLALFKNGELVDSVIGAVPKNTLKKFIEEQAL